MKAFEAQWLYAAVAYGDVTASFVAAVNDAHAKRYISIYNTLDVAIYVSFDGTNNHLYIGAGQALTPITGEASLYVSTPIYIKRASAASSGTVFISAAWGVEY